jgi:predicted protein tyrosine phosphatase
MKKLLWWKENKSRKSRRGFMIEITPNLFIGSETDFEQNVKYHLSEWYVIHACKEPYHRRLLGYTTRGAPQSSPEYLLARRDNVLYLNLVDVDNPKYVSSEIMDTSIDFIDEALKNGKKCLVHCNQGESRSPSIGLLYLLSRKIMHAEDMESAVAEFLKIYPSYNPKRGMREYLIQNWGRYAK